MYKINEQKMYYDMADGQAIVINFQSGMYYGMSSLGSAILDALLKGASKEAVLDALKALPGCPKDMDAQLTAFLTSLQDKEILVCTDDASANAGGTDGANGSTPAGTAADPAALAALSAPETLADGFVLDVNEYAEAMDLILADPIHDVNVDMGWPILQEQ